MTSPTRLPRWLRVPAALLAVLVALVGSLALLAPTPASAAAPASPPGCNADDSQVNITRSTAAAPIGAVVSWSVGVGNVTDGDGCDIVNRFVTLTLPNGTFQVFGPFNLPAGTAVSTVGSLNYTTDAADIGQIGVPGAWTATISWTGTLVDGFDQPSTGTKQLSINPLYPDVSVLKTADATPINAGANASFTILVTNHGPGSATNVTLTDTLPGTGWTEGSASCSITPGANDVLNCNFGTLAFPGSASVTVSRATSTADCGTLPNTATVTADNDTNPTNNSSQASIVVNCPDVSVLKTADVTPINAGDNASFTILVTNNGPGSATNVTLTDTLPGTGWTEGSASCSITPGANDILNCNFGTLAFPGSASVTVSRATTVADCGTLPNTATVSATGDTNAGNNSSQASIVVNCPDVSVLKTADATPINAGDNASFTILVTNNGPGSATNVTLTDTLPGTGWTEGSASCSITPGANDVLNCNFGTLTFPGSASVTVSRATTAADCGTLPNTATVSATGDTNAGNNSSQASIVVNCPDVSVLKTADATPINAGDNASFTILVTNNGPGSATNVTLTDTLPGTGWTEGSASCSITPGANDVLNCNFGTLAFPGSASVTVSRATTAADCGTLPNTATVSATGDTNSGNNESSASIVVNCADVSVLKTADATPINAGANASFTILVTNNGPGSASNVTLTDTLPGTGWTEGSASCSITPGANDVLNCNFGTLAFPGSASVTVSRATTAADCGTLPNTATVSATVDTNPANNESSASIVVNCPDVSVLKTADATPINAGDNASFTILVTNNGPGSATNVTLTDTLPGTGWTEGSASCTITPGVNDVLNCDFGTLAFPGSASVTVSRATSTADCGTMTNTAIVTATGDTNAGNNSSTATIDVICQTYAGCTPGFWRQEQHFQYWTGYTPGQSFEAVFSVDVTLRGTGKTEYTNPTLLQAVWANGGDVNALARHAVAALLNSTNPDVNYFYTEAQVIQMVHDAISGIGTLSIEDVHQLLAVQNELGCTAKVDGGGALP